LALEKSNVGMAAARFDADGSQMQISDDCWRRREHTRVVRLWMVCVGKKRMKGKGKIGDWQKSFI